MARTNRTSQRTIEAQERRAKAVQLRRMGWSYTRIAAQLGMTRSSVHKAVTKALTETQKALDLEADILRTQELERLDELQSYIWIEASKGNLKAVDRVLKVIERRARLLGLDAPAKIATTTPEGDEAAGGVFVVPAPAGSLDEWLEQVQGYQASKRDAEPET